MKFIDKKEVDKNALQKWDEDSIRLQRDLIEPYWNVKAAEKEDPTEARFKI